MRKGTAVPDVVGMTLLGAAQMVFELGLTIGVRLTDSDTHADGLVVGQQPPAGTVIPAGRQVLLSVVRSPQGA